jgi:hypothetical protein
MMAKRDLLQNFVTRICHFSNDLFVSKNDVSYRRRQREREEPQQSI